MYCRLAWGNVRNSLRDFGIYLLTISLGVAVFYAFNTMSEQSRFLSESTASILELLSQLIGGVTVVLAFVLGFLMVYANNFLVRRRKRELGLYQVLGMTKRQVSIVICLECGIASLLAFAIGLAIGVLISQFLVFITATLFGDRISQFGFIFSIQGLVYAAVCFGVMFCVTLVFDILTVGKMRIIDLVQGGRKVESQRLRPVWLCSILLVAALAILALAYHRLLRDGLPVNMDSDADMGPFLATTLLCVVGTFLLFWSLPSPAMALISRIKGYYLRDLHMFTVRQVASRVNTTAVAMAVTAFVLFLAMTSVTTGMSIATGLNTSLENGAPFSASTSVIYAHPSEGEYAMIASRAEEFPDEGEVALAVEPVDMAGWFEERYQPVMGYVTATTQIDIYDAAPRGYQLDEGSYARDGIAVLGAFQEVSGHPFPEQLASVPMLSELQVVTLTQYNAERALLGMEPVELAEDKYLLLCNLGPMVIDYYDAGLAANIPFTVGGRRLTPAQPQCVTNASAAIYDGAFGSDSGTLVVADELVADLPLQSSVLDIMVPRDQEEAFDEALERAESEWLVDDAHEQRLADANGATVAFVGMFVTRVELARSGATMTGLIGYLATYIGFVLVVGCAAILAIQQLSQTADSLGRYRLLYELGAPGEQVGRSVFSQTALCFGLPLCVGLGHSVVALLVLRQLMEIMSPIDVTSSIGLAAVIFVVVYGGYFLATYLMARRLADARHLGLRTG